MMNRALNLLIPSPIPNPLGHSCPIKCRLELFKSVQNSMKFSSFGFLFQSWDLALTQWKVHRCSWGNLSWVTIFFSSYARLAYCVVLMQNWGRSAALGIVSQSVFVCKIQPKTGDELQSPQRLQPRGGSHDLLQTKTSGFHTALVLRRTCTAKMEPGKEANPKFGSRILVWLTAEIGCSCKVWLCQGHLEQGSHYISTVH